MIIKGDKRLESVRVVVDEMLIQMADAEEKRCAYTHLYGVSEFAAMLAQKRGFNPELAAIAGMLHDFYVYTTNIREFHSHNGAEAVRPIIRDLGIFTNEEQKIILSAIFHHSDKNVINDVYDEIIKDADGVLLLSTIAVKKPVSHFQSGILVVHAVLQVSMHGLNGHGWIMLIFFIVSMKIVISRKEEIL